MDRVRQNEAAGIRFIRGTDIVKLLVSIVTVCAKQSSA